MNLSIRNIKSKFRLEKISGFIKNFFQKRTNYLILLVFLIMVGYGVFVWYRYVYNPVWSDSRKQEYMKTKDKGAVFNKVRFNDVVSEQQERQIRCQNDMSDLEDIFRLDK